MATNTGNPGSRRVGSGRDSAQLPPAGYATWLLFFSTLTPSGSLISDKSATHSLDILCFMT